MYMYKHVDINISGNKDNYQMLHVHDLEKM